MNERECFDIWAPPEAAWTEWAKPVLFAQLGAVAATPLDELVIPGVPWARSARGSRERGSPQGKTALVVDLDGVYAVALGIAFARAGFRPVPLFNSSRGIDEVVPTGGLCAALKAGAEL